MPDKSRNAPDRMRQIIAGQVAKHGLRTVKEWLDEGRYGNATGEARAALRREWWRQHGPTLAKGLLAALGTAAAVGQCMRTG
ncbi:hypothetical protein V9K97_13595 [Variovorax sp. CCNWLW186]|uniref:hypothetical protein n=1 Tax=Variovorax sp. CCNWLW186 TaxID=3127473 RepID=UPI000F9AA2F2